MRTIAPQSIRDDYLAALRDITTTFEAAELTDVAETGKKLIAEYSFLAAAILSEGFVSDLFVAYINRNNSVFSNYLTNHMEITPSGEHAQRAKDFANISIKKHLTAANIRSVLDSRDFNITFQSVNKMKEGAGKWLADPYKGYFTDLSDSLAATLSATKAIRNFLAHRSAASKSEMQQTLFDPNLPNHLRRGHHAVRDIGSFLRSHPTPQTPFRFEQYLAELRNIAGILCP